MTAYIQIVGWNHRPYLGACLRSCLRQTTPVPILYIDNGSTDGSAEYVRETFPAIRLHVLGENRGYSGGHNEGLRLVSDTDVAIVLNPDVVLEPDFVERGLSGFARPSTGAIAPLLFRDAERSTIDSFGTVLLSSLRAVNQFEGRPAIVAYGPTPMPLPWGFTGAAAFLRRRALEDVAIEGEIFDEDLFTYREDVDLSWRLRLRGWKILGEPKAVGTHVRAVRSGSQKDSRIAQRSWLNYGFVLAKDVPRGVLVRHLPGILLEGAARDVQMLLQPSLWPAVPKLFRLFPRFLRKRRQVLRRASAVRRILRSGELKRFPDGRIDYTNADEAPVLSCVVRNDDHILFLKRSERVGTYRGYWHIIGGYLDETGKAVEEKVLRELEEEVGIPRSAVERVSVGEPFEEFDPDVAKTWIIHPVLVDVRGDPSVRLDWEHTEYRWIRPSEYGSHVPYIGSLPEVIRRLGLV